MGLVARNTAALLCGAAMLVLGGVYGAQAQQVKPLTPEEQAAQDAAAGQAMADAPIDGSSVTVLDRITLVSRIGESSIETMGSVSQVSGEQLELKQPTSIANVLFGVPGVTVQTDAARAATTINIRGLQDFGRVAVIVDGARQNFQRSGHGTQSMFFVDPDLLQAVDVFRGPVANTYGSGAIGGVVVFETKDADSFLRPGETWAASTTARYETNGEGFTTSTTGAYRFNDAFDVLGNLVYRDYGDYTDGNGDKVLGTDFSVLSGLLKATVRPTENSRLRFGWIGANNGWTEGAGTSDIDVEQNTFTARYDIQDENESWLDLHINGSFNQTGMDQTYLTDVAQFDPVTGLPDIVPKGSQTSYNLDTYGFDIWNTSRFDTAELSHAVTYGGDWVKDDVVTDNPLGGSDVYTPSGERKVWGIYIEDKMEYDWLEIIAGLRYDDYGLESNVGGASGDRVSPRLTVGVSPFQEGTFERLQFYGTYAEGYRSPSVTETLISGMHPNGVTFPFLPNPNLQPETGKNWEVGVNFAKDALVYADDSLRIKAAYFNNDITDFIDLLELPAGAPGCPFLPGLPPVWVPGGYYVPACYQYDNFASAQIRGFEFEATYDAGHAFAGLTASIISGHRMADGIEEYLVSIPSSQVTASLGYRFLDRALTVGGEIQYNGAPKGAEYADDYTLVNIFANYQATENFRVDFRVDNLFDVQYVNPLNATTTSPVYEPGITVKLGATLRFGA